MPGGLLQLISNGTQDSFLSINPEFTFFKFVYKKHTNFSITYSNINFKTNFNFGSNNALEIPKYGDLITNINLLVHLPQINIEYTQTKFELLHTLKNDLHFINNIEYLNLLNNIYSVNNSIENKSLYNTIINFSDSNISSLNSNTVKIYHFFNDNTLLTSSNIYIQLNNNLLIDHDTNSSIFNNFNVDYQINEIHDILIDSNNSNSDIKSLLNLTFNNNINPLLVYLNTKSNDDYIFNHANFYLQKLFYKLLFYYTNNDYNLLSYYLISSKNYIDNNNILLNENFDSLNILQNNYILINTSDIINSNNILFICNTAEFNLKNIKSIIILNKTYINNNYLFELTNNTKSQSFFLSNSIYNLNLSSQELIYNVISDDDYTMTLDNNLSLEVDMILFGYNSDSNILPQTNPDFYIKILRIQNNNIDYELFDNRLHAYNLNSSIQNTNDLNEITYLFNDNNNIIPINYKIYFSDIWNNFEFLYNSNKYSINSLNKNDFYDLAITSSKNIMGNQKTILTNIINSYLIDSLYITLQFNINQSTLEVDEYIETNLNEESFTSITNRFTKNGNSVFSIDDASYINDKFVNKFLNIFFDSKDNFKIRINNSYGNIFIKNILNYSEVFNISNLISYFSQTPPFFTLKLILTSDQTFNNNILFLDEDDNLNNDNLLLTENMILYIYTTDISSNYSINESESDNFIGTYKVSNIDVNDAYIKVEIYNDYTNYSDRLGTDDYLYLVYKDAENNVSYKLKCNNNFIDHDLLIINTSELNFIDFNNSFNGENTNSPIDDGTYYLYEISNNNFNFQSANFVKEITLSYTSGNNLYFYIDSSETFDYNFEFDKYSYFAFKYQNIVNLRKGIKVNSITFNSRYFNSNITQYNNITDSTTRGYKYTNIIYIYLCLFLFDELKSSSTHLNNILLFRLNNISSKIFNLITSNSAYSENLEQLSGSIKFTFLADFSTIFNSNTIINELFDNTNNIFDSYFFYLKESLLNKVLYENDYDGNLITYNYLKNDVLYYKVNVNDNTMEEITDSNIISIIIDYYSKSLSNLYDSDLNSLYSTFNKELFYISANDFVINEYLNIIDYTYYDDIKTKISSEIGTRFFNIINNDLFFNRDILNNLVESNILEYGNIHIIDNKNEYIVLLNSFYEIVETRMDNFLSNESIISSVSNLDIIDNLSLSDTEIKELIYTSLNLVVGDNVDFDTNINIIFNDKETSKSINTFLNNMILNNEIYNYINKFLFLMSIYQINSLLPSLIKNHNFNELYKYDNTIQSNEYVIIDDLYVPKDLETYFNEKLNYIRSLSSLELDIEKDIYNYEKTFLKKLKDVYFSNNNNYITVKVLESEINDNILSNESYKFIRGCLVTNNEYDLINFDPLVCNINNVNITGGIIDIFIPFDLNNIFFYNDDYPITLLLNDSTLQITSNNNPFPAENSLTNYNIDDFTYNINVKFQMNIKSVENVIDNKIGISTNGVILKNAYFSNINSVTSPDSIYKIKISSTYYFDYSNLIESSSKINIGDTLNLYKSSLINTSNMLNVSIVITDITDDIITFSSPYNVNINENTYGMLDNNKGIQFISVNVQSFRLNLMYYFDQLSNIELDFSAHVNENNEFNYYSGKFINSLVNISNNYYNNSHFDNDKLRHTNGHSKIVGISLDGYPIYGPYGFINTEISKIKSSYKLKNEFTEERINLIEVSNGNITNYGIGSFVEDYEYVESYGDLDEFNGRFCITPDFPQGTYAYFITLDDNNEPVFPYIMTDKFYGSVSSEQYNDNISLNISSYNVNDSIIIVQDKGKYGTGVILSDDNNIKYISVINDGFDYELKKCYVLKDLPSTLEYSDKYRILVRRRSILGNGYYYNFTDDKIENILTEVDFNDSLTNLILDIENMYYNGIDPVLQLVEDNDNLLQILFLDEYVNYLTIINDSFDIVSYINTKNIYIKNLINDVIELLFDKFKQHYYLYYDSIVIEKDYNLKNINIDLNKELISINENKSNLDKYNSNEIEVLSRSSKPNFNWIVNVGNFLLNKVELYMNDLLIDRHYSEWINIWYELNNTYAKKELRERMIGSTYDLFTNNSNVKKGYNLILPMYFWFNRYSGLNLPVIAMSNVKLYLKLYIEDLDKLVVRDSNTKIVLEEDLDIKLNIGYVYLDDNERDNFAKGRHEYLIENTQFNEYNLDENNLVDICFKNSVKDLFWFIDYEDRVLGTYESLIKNTKILVNNTTLLNMDNIYTNYVIPYEKYKSCVFDGINVYSFNLSNTEFQPSGSLNFSMLDNVQFKLTLVNNELKNKKIKIFANSYNILRIMSGLAGLAFYE